MTKNPRDFVFVQKTMTIIDGKGVSDAKFKQELNLV